MKRFMKKFMNSSGFLSRRVAMLSAVAATGLVVAGSLPAKAQLSTEGNGSTTVDLGLLRELGLQTGYGAPLPGSGGRRLIMPGLTMPRSQYYAPGPVNLKKPGEQPVSRLTVPPPPELTAPAAPVRKAEAPPPPPPAAAQATVLAPAPPEPAPPPAMPVVPAEVVALAPVVEPQLETTAEVTAEMKTEAAPEPMDAASEPPPALTPPAPPPESPESPESVASAVEAPSQPMEAAAVPEPPAMPKVVPPEAAAEAQQEATLTPAGDSLAPGRAMQVVFEGEGAKLPETFKEDLKTLAAQLRAQKNLRIQLLAYAGGESLSAGKSRRLSLSRALSVRSFLIENEVRSTRIDVRALGNKTSETPLNRVDVNVVER